MKKYLMVIVSFIALAACSDKDKDEMAGGGNKDGTFFKLMVNGAPRELENIHYARSAKNVHLATWGSSGFPSLNVTLTTTTEDDFRGSYLYSYDLAAGTSIILYGLGQSNGYESHWWDCPPDAPLLMPSPGNLRIENIERSNGEEYITGSFSVQQYQPQGDCPYVEIKQINITGSFRLKRAR